MHGAATRVIGRMEMTDRGFQATIHKGNMQSFVFWSILPPFSFVSTDSFSIKAEKYLSR